jgi:hypothetical protein
MGTAGGQDRARTRPSWRRGRSKGGRGKVADFGGSGRRSVSGSIFYCGGEVLYPWFCQCSWREVACREMFQFHIVQVSESCLLAVNAASLSLSLMRSCCMPLCKLPTCMACSCICMYQCSSCLFMSLGSVSRSIDACLLVHLVHMVNYTMPCCWRMPSATASATLRTMCFGRREASAIVCLSPLKTPVSVKIDTHLVPCSET